MEVTTLIVEKIIPYLDLFEVTGHYDGQRRKFIVDADQLGARKFKLSSGEIVKLVGSAPSKGTVEGIHKHGVR